MEVPSGNLFSHRRGFQCMFHSYEPNGNRPTAAIAAFSAGILFVFFLYLAVYLQNIKRETREWNLICPVQSFLPSEG